MPSDFEKQQRWQLLLWGVVIWGIPIAIVLGLAGLITWVLIAAFNAG